MSRVFFFLAARRRRKGKKSFFFFFLSSRQYFERHILPLPRRASNLNIFQCVNEVYACARAKRERLSREAYRGRRRERRGEVFFPPFFSFSLPLPLSSPSGGGPCSRAALRTENDPPKKLEIGKNSLFFQNRNSKIQKKKSRQGAQRPPLAESVVVVFGRGLHLLLLLHLRHLRSVQQ